MPRRSRRKPASSSRRFARDSGDAAKGMTCSSTCVVRFMPLDGLSLLPLRHREAIEHRPVGQSTNPKGIDNANALGPATDGMAVNLLASKCYVGHALGRAARGFAQVEEHTVKFRAKLALNGKTATGISVPEQIVDALAAGRRPAVMVTVNGYSFSTTLESMEGVAKIPSKPPRRRKRTSAGSPRPSPGFVS